MSRAVLKDSRPAYRPYRARVARLVMLSPSFVRVTFASDDFDVFGTDGFDQRLKIIVPVPGRNTIDIDIDDQAETREGTWYSRYRAQSPQLRNPIRTYTVRAVRPEDGEVDVDMVLHGDTGPATKWLNRAAVGDEVVIVGPDARSIHSMTGIDWRPGTASQYLIVGDETAAPAICSVLEMLPEHSTATAFIEVPDRADACQIASPATTSVKWLARMGQPTGTLLVPAVREWVASNRHLLHSSLAGSAQPLDDVDVDLGLLWDSPEAPDHGAFYAWLAGEAAVIKTLRRFLVSETGIDRSRVAFMGYWRTGKAEA